jgi:hypothetical protein
MFDEVLKLGVVVRLFLIRTRSTSGLENHGFRPVVVILRARVPPSGSPSDFPSCPSPHQLLTFVPNPMLP